LKLYEKSGFMGAILQLVGCGDSTHRCRDSGIKPSEKLILQTVGANFVRLLFGSPAGELDWRSQD